MKENYICCGFEGGREDGREESSKNGGFEERD
jgi:hypothetical protein